MNMETIISFLALTVLGIGVAVFILTKIVNSKFNNSVQKLVSQNNSTVQNSTINNIKTELESVVKGLEFYKEESRHWYQEYKKEIKERQNLQEEIITIKREVSTLRYIVDKMDGKVIVRDEHLKIKHIRAVK